MHKQLLQAHLPRFNTFTAPTDGSTAVIAQALSEAKQRIAETKLIRFYTATNDFSILDLLSLASTAVVRLSHSAT